MWFYSSLITAPVTCTFHVSFNFLLITCRHRFLSDRIIVDNNLKKHPHPSSTHSLHSPPLAYCCRTVLPRAPSIDRHWCSSCNAHTCNIACEMTRSETSMRRRRRRATDEAILFRPLWLLRRNRHFSNIEDRCCLASSSSWRMIHWENWSKRSDAWLVGWVSSLHHRCRWHCSSEDCCDENHHPTRCATVRNLSIVFARIEIHPYSCSRNPKHLTFDSNSG